MSRVYLSKSKRIALIEEKYGRKFECVLKDFARDCSFSFTMNALGLARQYFTEYKHLFDYNKRPPREHRGNASYWDKRAKRINGYKIPEIAEMAGVSVRTIYQRIYNGWSDEDLFKPKQKQGNVENFGTKRNIEKWRNWNIK